LKLKNQGTENEHNYTFCTQFGKWSLHIEMERLSECLTIYP